DIGADLPLHFAPRGAQLTEIGEAVGRQQRGRRVALPPLIPRPLGGVGMRDRLTHRLEAAPEIAVVLIRRQWFERSEHTIARPVVIVDERLQVGEIHGNTLARRRRSSRGNSRSRYALPPSNNGCCLPARIPPPAVSPYSLLSASATSMPWTTSPKGTNPCSS